MLLLLGLVPACGSSAAAEQQSVPVLAPVEVIAPTPLPDVGLPLEQIPANVQTAPGKEIERRNATDLTDFLNREFGSVHVNEVQGNPFQPDVNFRGYTASPLLGTPQGLSLYMDGVRLNQPFGDVVKLGPDPTRRNRIDHTHPGFQSSVRSEHVGWRTVDPDERRPHCTRHIADGVIRAFRPAHRRTPAWRFQHERARLVFPWQLHPGTRLARRVSLPARAALFEARVA